jgi:hypothetical protein
MNLTKLSPENVNFDDWTPQNFSIAVVQMVPMNRDIFSFASDEDSRTVFQNVVF